MLNHLLAGFEITAGVTASAACGKAPATNHNPTVDASRTPAGDVTTGTSDRLHGDRRRRGQRPAQLRLGLRRRRHLARPHADPRLRDARHVHRQGDRLRRQGRHARPRRSASSSPRATAAPTVVATRDPAGTITTGADGHVHGQRQRPRRGHADLQLGLRGHQLDARGADRHAHVPDARRLRRPRDASPTARAAPRRTRSRSRWSARACTNGYRDDFNGTALGAGWSVVRGDAQLTVGNGVVSIPTQAGDLYQTANTAKNIVLRTAPTGAFTMIAKLNHKGLVQYQQAGIIVYGTDDNYVKIDRTATNTATDPATRRSSSSSRRSTPPRATPPRTTPPTSPRRSRRTSTCGSSGTGRT